MSTELLAPAMFAVLAVALMTGFPVAFSVAAVAAVFGAIGIASGHFQPAFLLAATLRIEGFFLNDNLLAIPLFVFMGMLLERTRIAADMLLALDELLGAVRGGMAYTVVLVAASLAAITGIVSAAVLGLGLIALPAMAMLRKGYGPRLATGVIAASGTLAQILPPSLVLIVLAEQLEVSLMDIFRGALLPSALLVTLYLAYVYLATRLWPDRAPAGPSDAGCFLAHSPAVARRRGGPPPSDRTHPADPGHDLLWGPRPAKAVHSVSPERCCSGWPGANWI